MKREEETPADWGQKQHQQSQHEQSTHRHTDTQYYQEQLKKKKKGNVPMCQCANVHPMSHNTIQDWVNKRNNQK